MMNVVQPRSRSGLLAAAIFASGLALAVAGGVGLAWAGDEEHQLVGGARATFEVPRNILRVEVLLANGDRVEGIFEGSAIDRVLKVLDIGVRPDVSLYADLEGKKLANLTVEFGRPIPYRERRKGDEPVKQ